MTGIRCMEMFILTEDGCLEVIVMLLLRELLTLLLVNGRMVREKILQMLSKNINCMVQTIIPIQRQEPLVMHIKIWELKFI